MVTMNSSTRLPHARGASMIEVLVTIVILAVGLMGVAGLQGRLQVSEMEGYQRSQAMILLDDMAYRFAANRNFAADYVTTAANPTGAGVTCPVVATTMQQRDTREWCLALQGAGEKTSADVKVGAMIGGRGCVEALPNNEYLITVAWQGTGPVSAPPASVACGANQYDGAGCTNDRCRRVVTTIVKIAPLI
jgi:type IV pilus assembly protein PilV